MIDVWLRKALLGILGGRTLGRLTPVSVKGRGVIVCLHSVRPAEPGPFAPLADLHFDPARLTALLGELRRRDIAIIPLSEVVPAVHGRGGPPFVCFTFDDGYRDNCQSAWPIFQRWAAPFTIFLTTGFIAGDLPMPWSLLERLIRRETEFVLDDGRGLRRWRTQTAAEKRRAYHESQSLFRHADRARMDMLLADVRQRYGTEVIAEARTEAMTWDMVRAMARDPLVAFGAHTVSHPMVGRLDPAEAARELTDSKAVIEREIGRPVDHFAFPFGNHAAIGAEAAGLARTAGFGLAVTTLREVLTPASAADPLCLPRITLDGHYQGLPQVFGQMSGWPAALKRRFRAAPF